ncbi:hypothetical protein SALBM217S_05755 [Streptomyces griseoloalbus]
MARESESGLPIDPVYGPDALEGGDLAEKLGEPVCEPAEPQGDPVLHRLLRAVRRPAYAYPALSFVVLGTLAQVASVLYLSALIFAAPGSPPPSAVAAVSAGATSAAGALFLGFAAKLSTASA